MSKANFGFLRFDIRQSAVLLNDYGHIAHACLGAYERKWSRLPNRVKPKKIVLYRMFCPFVSVRGISWRFTLLPIRCARWTPDEAPSPLGVHCAS